MDQKHMIDDTNDEYIIITTLNFYLNKDWFKCYNNYDKNK